MHCCRYPLHQPDVSEFPLRKGGIKDQSISKNLSVEGNWTSVSVAQWTRQKLKLFQLLLLFRLKDQPWKFLANKEKQKHCIFIWLCKQTGWIIHHCFCLIQHVKTTKVIHVLFLSVIGLMRKIKWRHWKMRTGEPVCINWSKSSEELDYLYKPKKLLKKKPQFPLTPLLPR